MLADDRGDTARQRERQENRGTDGRPREHQHGTETPSTAILISRYGMPQMMLIAMNNSHPRELTSTTLRVASDGL